MSKICFVIQPISDEKFTKRYEDIYKPAIEAVGLTPYRVDLDPSAHILIDEIESMIKKSIICFADISIDNPNVWYELGYAFASERDVVMVCDEERSNFPFDVRHKNIIRYKTESASDFLELKFKIEEKLKAYIKLQGRTEKLIRNPIKETDGLQPYELTLLAFIIGEQYTDEEVVVMYDVREKMKKAGFTDTAISIGTHKLKEKGLIETRLDSDFNGNQYPVCSLSKGGIDFVLSNTGLFNLEQTSAQEKIQQTTGFLDDLPF